MRLIALIDDGKTVRPLTDDGTTATVFSSTADIAKTHETHITRKLTWHIVELDNGSVVTLRTP